jgi:hypothetical protein
MSTTAVTEVARPADYPDVAMYIDGAWVQGTAGRGGDVVNPATGQALGRVPFSEPEDVDRAIEAARVAFRAWRDAGPEARSAILLRASALIHQRAADIGRVMTLEEGKPLPEATGEVHRAATLLAWDCEEGRRAYGRMHEAVHHGTGRTRPGDRLRGHRPGGGRQVGRAGQGGERRAGVHLAQPLPGRPADPARVHRRVRGGDAGDQGR